MIVDKKTSFQKKKKKKKLRLDEFPEIFSYATKSTAVVEKLVGKIRCVQL